MAQYLLIPITDALMGLCVACVAIPGLPGPLNTEAAGNPVRTAELGDDGEGLALLEGDRAPAVAAVNVFL